MFDESAPFPYSSFIVHIDAEKSGAMQNAGRRILDCSRGKDSLVQGDLHTAGQS
jgi:hypothetical protein